MTASTEPIAELASAHVVAKIPLVSVLVPVFNAERYVEAAVRSVLGQTFCDFELLIIDDGSTDDSLRIVRVLAEGDSRVRLTSRMNKGLVDTLNELLLGARSPFIARMDADDLAHPARFERQLQAFDTDPELLIVGSDVHSIDDRGRYLMTIVMPHEHDAIDAFTMGAVNGCGMCHPSMMFRAQAFDLAGSYRKEFWPAEDADLVLRIAEHGRVFNLPEPLLSYRVHSGSIGHTQAERQRDALWRAAAAAAERRGIAPPDESLRKLQANEKSSIETPFAQDIKWAWWALSNGQVATARSLAMRAVLRAPLHSHAWRVLACAIRGH
ncbi:MAG: glycosyltransferase [Ramlibacter sp.]|nr:glycosyltransferase [Ramlibacter sp.]